MIFILKSKSKKFYLISKNFCRFESIFAKDGQTLRASDQLNHSYLPPFLKKIEAEWKPFVDNYWKSALRKSSTSKTSRYILAMFPYPSGSLHLGSLLKYLDKNVKV